MVAAISWSGGKDGWLALVRARRAGLDVRYALTMFDESGARSRSHAIPPDVVALQARALGLEAVSAPTSWQSYEQSTVAALRGLSARGVDTAVFGDIDIPAHRAFEERVCAAAALQAELPLWQQDRATLVEDMFSHGLKAVVVTTDDRFLDGAYCGRRFDRDFVASLPREVCPCGENGEFHTFVVGGAGFAAELPIVAGPSYAHAVNFEGGTAAYHFAPLRQAVASLSADDAREQSVGVGRRCVAAPGNMLIRPNER
jgi:diphthine-ammonia ligase